MVKIYTDKVSRFTFAIRNIIRNYLYLRGIMKQYTNVDKVPLKMKSTRACQKNTFLRDDPKRKTGRQSLTLLMK